MTRPIAISLPSGFVRRFGPSPLTSAPVKVTVWPTASCPRTPMSRRVVWRSIGCERFAVGSKENGVRNSSENGVRNWPTTSAGCSAYVPVRAIVAGGTSSM